MDFYSDSELEEIGYFCKDCGGHPCNCEFIQAYNKYGDIICDDKSKILVDDLYDFKSKLDTLNKGIDELIKKYEDMVKLFDGDSYIQTIPIEMLEDLKKLKGE